MKPIVFLGGGRITGALITGLRLGRYKMPIIVCDRHPAKLRQLKKQYGITVEPNLHRAVDQAGILIIAVRPASVAGLLHEIGGIKRPVNAVSLAAGIPLSRLRTALGSPVRWARAMPSPASRSGQGLAALTFQPGFSSSGKREIIELFAKVGPTIEIPESQFDAFTVTYSSSHGYHALVTLADAAVNLGLNRKTALLAAAHALADGIVAWRDSHTSLPGLIGEAATPGGIAAAVMEAMDRAGYKRAVNRGLQAGMARARKNAKRV